MRVLVDTAIWIDHLRSSDARLVSLLREDQVVSHDHVVGELAMGSLRDRRVVLDSMLDLPRAPLAEEAEVRGLIENRQLFARGIGYSDAHILASLVLHGALSLWTRDGRLAAVAGELRIRDAAP
jgi:predicted nucleic acid-binding protein